MTESDVNAAADNAEVVGDERSVALAAAREASAEVRALAEQARGGRLLESEIINVSDRLDAALNAVADTVSPGAADATAVQSFVGALRAELDRLSATTP